MAVRTSVIEDLASLAALRGQWNELLARSAVDGPMMSPAWLVPWWRVYGKGGRKLAALAFEAEGRLVGLAPLLLRTHRYDGGVPFRRLELLGTGEAERDETCSEHLGILCERGAEPTVFRAFAEALAFGGPAPWDELVLMSLDAAPIQLSTLRAEFDRMGIHTEVDSLGAAPFIPLPASWEDYLRSLPSSSRYLVTRTLRDYERWAGDASELRIASTPEEFREGKRILTALHADRWEGGGAFASPLFRAFHDTAMPELLAEGALDLLWLTVENRPVAAAYHLVWRGKVYFYQAGRSLEVPKGQRPGIVLHAHAIRRAIEHGFREYDFLAGRSLYKRKLSLASRPLVRLRAVRERSGSRERLRCAGELGRSVARAARTALRSGGSGSARNDDLDPSAVGAVLLGDLNMLRCFADTGIRTLLLGTDAEDPTFFSRHCAETAIIASPATAPEAALADLVLVGQKLRGRPPLFYGDDGMLLLVSRNRCALGRSYRFLLPDPDRVEVLVDKLRFATLAEALGLPVPPTVVSTEVASLSDLARWMKPPYVLKPYSHLGWNRSAATRGLGSVKALCVSTAADLAHMAERIERFSDRYVIQQYIPGGEDHIATFHAYVDARGKPLAHFVGRKIRTCPRRAGESTFLETVLDPEVTRTGLDILERTGHVGIVKLDFKRDARDGRLYLLEVNPRFSLWNYLGAAAGLNLPLVAMRDLTGIAVDPGHAARPGVRWLAIEEDVRGLLQEGLGPVAFLAWLRSLQGPMVHDVFDWHDAAPFAAHVVRSLHRAARRRYRERP